MNKTPISEFLTNKFLEWQLESGEIQTTTQFAEYLGISKSYLSMLMSGERETMGPQTAAKIAARLGDAIYEITEHEPIDPLLNILTQAWDNIPEEEKYQIQEIAEPYIPKTGRKNEPKTGKSNAESTP